MDGMYNGDYIKIILLCLVDFISFAKKRGKICWSLGIISFIEVLGISFHVSFFAISL